MSIEHIEAAATDPAATSDDRARSTSLRGHRALSLFTPGFIIVVLVLLVVLLWAVVPWLFTGYDPLVGTPSEKLQGPSIAHWFGTDHLGRDVYARIVYGTIQTLVTAGIAVGIGFTLGSLIGLLAATAGSAVDSVSMRLIDVLLALPAFLISVSIVAAFGPGPITIGIGVGISSIAIFARVMRSEVLRVRNYDFVEAAFLSGGRYWGILFRHVLPNSAGPILALVAIDLSAAILAISGLGFLGFGAPPPTPEWGLLISEGRNYLGTAWWLTTFPGLVILVTVIALAALSRHLMKLNKI